MRAPSRRRRPERGESLVEVVVSTLLLAVGALALVGGLAWGERARGRALEEGLARAAAVSWLESWRASHWEPGSRAGSESPLWGGRAGRLEWAVAPAGACLEQAVVTATPATGAPVTIESRRFGEDACDE